MYYYKTLCSKWCELEKILRDFTYYGHIFKQETLQLLGKFFGNVNKKPHYMILNNIKVF